MTIVMIAKIGRDIIMNVMLALQFYIPSLIPKKCISSNVFPNSAIK